jgi:hypothetical protein
MGDLDVPSAVMVGGIVLFQTLMPGPVSIGVAFALRVHVNEELKEAFHNLLTPVTKPAKV